MARGLQRPRVPPKPRVPPRPRSAIKVTQPKPQSATFKSPWSTTFNTQASQANQAKEAAERREAAYREQQAAQRAAAAPKPVAPGAVVPTPPPAPVTAPPVEDDEYALNVGNLIRDITTSRANLKAAGEQDKSDVQKLIEQLIQQRDERLQDTTLDSNREGLLYSTTLSKRRGAVEKDATERQLEQQEFLRRRDAEREAQLADIGEIIADQNTPGGYRATGRAAGSLGQFLLDAIARRDARNAELAPPPIEDDPAPAPEAPGPAYAAVLPPRQSAARSNAAQSQARRAAAARARAQEAEAKAKSRSKKKGKR